MRCSGHDFFIVKPDNNPAMFSYAPGIGNLKYSCIASAFTKEASQGQLECQFISRTLSKNSPFLL